MQIYLYLYWLMADLTVVKETGSRVSERGQKFWLEYFLAATHKKR